MLFADLALAQRLERNEALNTADYALAQKRLLPESAARVLPVADGYATFTEAAFPVNRAIGLGMPSPVTSADLDTVETFYRGFGLPAKVDLNPLSDRSLAEELGRRCYRIVQFFNVQVRPLAPEDAEIASAAPIRVAPVAAEDGELWATTIAGSSFVRESVPADDPWLALARIAFHRPGVTCFLAWLGDELAGAAALMIRDDLATLFSTTTLLAYRNRGVQAALIRARLAFAARSGCNLATVSTVPGNQSQRNVQRAGFQMLYTRMAMQRDLTGAAIQAGLP